MINRHSVETSELELRSKCLPGPCFFHGLALCIASLSLTWLLRQSTVALLGTGALGETHSFSLGSLQDCCSGRQRQLQRMEGEVQPDSVQGSLSCRPCDELAWLTPRASRWKRCREWGADKPLPTKATVVLFSGLKTALRQAAGLLMVSAAVCRHHGGSLWSWAVLYTV